MQTSLPTLPLDVLGTSTNARAARRRRPLRAAGLLVLLAGLGVGACHGSEPPEESAADADPPIRLDPVFPVLSPDARPRIVASIDEGRVAVLARAPVSNFVVALFGREGLRWSRAVPCDQEWTNVGFTVGPDVVALRCPLRLDPEIRTIALRTSDGELAWTSEAEPFQRPIGRFGEVRASRVGDVLLEYHRGASSRLRSVADGRLLLEGGAPAKGALWHLPGLLFERGGGAAFRRVGSSGTVAVPGRLIGATADALCLLDGSEVVFLGDDGARRVALGREGLRELRRLGFADGRSGQMIRCARRGGAAVLLFDALERGVVAVAASDGTLRGGVTVPRLRHDDIASWWGGDLPRHVPVLSRDARLRFVDLDDLRETGSIALGDGSPEPMRGIRIIRRTGPLFWMQVRDRVLALDGETGRLLAADASFPGEGVRMDLAMAGRAIWRPVVSGAGLTMVLTPMVDVARVAFMSGFDRGPDPAPAGPDGGSP